MTQRIVVAGWWTGWHVFPIVNVVEYATQNLEADSYKVWWFGSKKWFEYKKYVELRQKMGNIFFVPVWTGKWRRQKTISAFLRNIIDLMSLSFWSVWAFFTLLWYRVDVVFCKGWYVALPVVLAAIVLRKKIVVHESDAKMWLTNKIAAKFATEVYVAFDDVYKWAENIGQLLTHDLIQERKFSDFEKIVDVSIDREKTCVLVMGWSQWSQSLYQALYQCMDQYEYVNRSFVFIVVWWLLNKEVSKMFTGKDDVIVLDFVKQKDISLLYQYCDIAITRSGTTSLAEQKLRDMLLLMVPLPWTHDQYDNALYYSDNYDDMIIEQNDDMVASLLEKLRILQTYKKQITTTVFDRHDRICYSKDRLLSSLMS